MPADGRQGGGDDGLVECAQKHRQHDAEHDGPNLGMRERARLCRLSASWILRVLDSCLLRRAVDGSAARALAKWDKCGGGG